MPKLITYRISISPTSGGWWLWEVHETTTGASGGGAPLRDGCCSSSDQAKRSAEGAADHLYTLATKSETYTYSPENK